MLSDGGDPGYRRGLISRVVAVTKAGGKNAVGDLVAQKDGYLQTWSQMDALPGPSEFNDYFLGVLQEGNATGAETQDTRALVFTEGGVLFPLNVMATKGYPCGTFVMAVGDAVVALDETSNASTMVGKVAEPVKAGDREVLFSLRSRVMS